MYMKRVGMFRNFKEDSQENHETSKTGIKYDSVVSIDLSDAQVTISGPKKSKERVLLEHVSENFYQSLTKLYDIPSNRLGASINIDLGNLEFIYGFYIIRKFFALGTLKVLSNVYLKF